IDLAGGGPGQIADRDGVGAAQRLEIDRLHAVDVHHDVGDVAGEPYTAAIGRDVDLLVDVGAVEQQRVGAALPLDDVAAIARVPDEGVVAGAEQGRVVAGPAIDDVVAGAADDDVIAGAAIEREVDRAGAEAGRVDPVVAGERVHGERVDGVRATDGRLRGEPVGAGRRAAAGQGDAIV